MKILWSERGDFEPVDNTYIFYPIISYQIIKVYRVETMDIGRFCCNNGVSGKYNPST